MAPDPTDRWTELSDYDSEKMDTEKANNQ